MKSIAAGPLSPNCLSKCLLNRLSPTREGFLSSFKNVPAAMVFAGQLSSKNCLSAIFAARHLDVSPGPLGRACCCRCHDPSHESCQGNTLGKRISNALPSRQQDRPALSLCGVALILDEQTRWAMPVAPPLSGAATVRLADPKWTNAKKPMMQLKQYQLDIFDNPPATKKETPKTPKTPIIPKSKRSFPKSRR